MRSPPGRARKPLSPVRRRSPRSGRAARSRRSRSQGLRSVRASPRPYPRRRRCCWTLSSLLLFPCLLLAAFLLGELRRQVSSFLRTAFVRYRVVLFRRALRVPAFVARLLRLLLAQVLGGSVVGVVRHPSGGSSTIPSAV